MSASDAVPAVSVIIPCWNQASFLAAAVESVVLQSFTDWEVVIVDDGSPDDTAAVAESLIRSFPDRRIRLVRQENRGLSGARNAGSAAARGRYLLPLDADDLLAPTFLEKTVAALEGDRQASIAFTDVIQFNEQQRAYCRMGPFSLDELRNRNVACCTSLFRREAWELAGGFNPNMVLGYEDWDFWLGCASRGLRAVHVPEGLFLYRVKDSSMVSGAMRSELSLRARMVLNHPEVFPPHASEWAEAVLAHHPLPGSPSESRPLVSIVVPCFQQADTLPMTLASVVSQSITDWELIVVDDGSPDDTSKIVLELARTLPERRIKLLRQENAGLSNARNAGFAAAQGRYLLPLDSDDLLDARFLEKTIAALESNPNAAVVSTDGFTFGARQEPLRPRKPFGPESLREGNCLHYCSLMRRSVFDRVGGYNPNMSVGYEDWDFWLGAAEMGIAATHLAEPLFFYRVKAQSMFTAAVEWSEPLHARIALNHPEVFPPRMVAEAKEILARRPLPPAKAPTPVVQLHPPGSGAASPAA